ncbi:MAG: glycosyltransferase [Oscillospiraceae bacterium]|nr:glycosyltransferase [Oscillospiraceae bacterium]
MDKIAILIPCYNEQATVGTVVQDCKRLLPEATIYVYDNNSSDDTATIAAREGAIVRRESQQGKGNVIRRMFREIDALCYIMIDGDNTYPLEHAKEMTELVLNDKIDMVVGDRLSSSYFTENKRRFHSFGNRMVRGTINMLFKRSAKDIMSGYRAFSYEFVKTFPVLSKGFEVETEMTIHAISRNMSIVELPVAYRDRPEGSVSKLNTYSDGLRVLGTIFNLFRNNKPLSFFGTIALLLVGISVAFFIPYVLIPFINTGLVLKFPTLIVCVFVALCGIFAFFGGVILETISFRDKQAFEFRLQQVDMTKKQLIAKENKANE